MQVVHSFVDHVPSCSRGLIATTVLTSHLKPCENSDTNRTYLEPFHLQLLHYSADQRITLLQDLVIANLQEL